MTIKEIYLITLEQILDTCDKEMLLSPNTYKMFVKLVKAVEKDFNTFKD